MNVLRAVWFYFCLPFVVVGKILVAIEIFALQTHASVEAWGEKEEIKRLQRPTKAEAKGWADLNDAGRKARILKARAARNLPPRKVPVVQEEVEEWAEVEAMTARLNKRLNAENK